MPVVARTYRCALAEPHDRALTHTITRVHTHDTKTHIHTHKHMRTHDFIKGERDVRILLSHMYRHSLKEGHATLLRITGLCRCLGLESAGRNHDLGFSGASDILGLMHIHYEIKGVMVVPTEPPKPYACSLSERIVLTHAEMSGADLYLQATHSGLTQ